MYANRDLAIGETSWTTAPVRPAGWKADRSRPLVSAQISLGSTVFATPPTLPRQQREGSARLPESRVANSYMITPPSLLRPQQD